MSPPKRSAPAPARKPFLDNTPLLLAGILALIAALAVLLLIGRGSSTLAPDFLTDFVLSALWATNLTILVALAFVLTRNILKLVVETRRALPRGARGDRDARRSVRAGGQDLRRSH